MTPLYHNTRQNASKINPNNPKNATKLFGKTTKPDRTRRRADDDKTAAGDGHRWHHRGAWPNRTANSIGKGYNSGCVRFFSEEEERTTWGYPAAQCVGSIMDTMLLSLDWGKDGREAAGAWPSGGADLAADSHDTRSDTEATGRWWIRPEALREARLCAGRLLVGQPQRALEHAGPGPCTLPHDRSLPTAAPPGGGGRPLEARHDCPHRVKRRQGKLQLRQARPAPGRSARRLQRYLATGWVAYAGGRRLNGAEARPIWRGFGGIVPQRAGAPRE